MVTPSQHAYSTSHIGGASRLALAILALFAFMLAGCASRFDQPPETKMIDMGFFSCAKCGSLSGGIFGKGPTRHYRSTHASRCRHEWQSVAKPEFQQFATDRFAVDWSSESGFWAVSPKTR